ncbi:WRKY DNA-binding transcription factor 70-like [Magnolia sinica]|uniref:WRKY DNA-binding transcription factor 70-like n=1 Tax=Magnolia sinica TaxID=86752 RepID=UPI00265922FA|nr:WRKY DNA-binding transcription factor 70-like [Magnolia sinica]
MEALPPENSPIIDCGKAIQELIDGQEYATQLQNLFQKAPLDQGLESAEILLDKVAQSFSNALSVLNSGVIDKDRWNPSTTQLCSSCSDDRGVKNSGHSKKIPVAKDRRGTYKRRRTSDTWTKVSATPIDDGYSWRKYGQKEILGARFPRSYFRCTHKNDQGCQATKQVQQTEDDGPSMYRITYMGHHTCKDLLKASYMLDSTSRDSFLLNFESNSISKQEQPLFFTSYTSIKQEVNEEMRSDLTQSSSPSSGYPMPSDIPLFELCDPLPTFSMAGSDTGDVVSGVYSCASSPTLNMDFSTGIDDIFSFDDGEY